MFQLTGIPRIVSFSCYLLVKENHPVLMGVYEVKKEQWNSLILKLRYQNVCQQCYLSCVLRWHRSDIEFKSFQVVNLLLALLKSLILTS